MPRTYIAFKHLWDHLLLLFSKSVFITIEMFPFLSELLQVNSDLKTPSPWGCPHHSLLSSSNTISLVTFIYLHIPLIFFPDITTLCAFRSSIMPGMFRSVTNDYFISLAPTEQNKRKANWIQYEMLKCDHKNDVKRWCDVIPWWKSIVMLVLKLLLWSQNGK